MVFKSIIGRFRRRALLCCSGREPKRSLDIGSPTDVRRVDIRDAIPNITEAELKNIREKPSSDVVHLLEQHSLPPSHPASSPPSPTNSSSPSIAPASALSSREPSMALLNAASKDLPTALLTPPCRPHHENSPPASRMKSMWNGSKRLSNSSTCHDGLYEKLESLKGADSGDRGLTQFFVTLNLDFDIDGKHDSNRPESARTLFLTEGLEMQDTKGGNVTPVAKNLVVKQAIEATQLGDSFVAGEHRPLVKI
ncbi:hypothetical protein PSPO01_16352 [Paraphaeosphaeria sporulosa]